MAKSAVGGEVRGKKILSQWPLWLSPGINTIQRMSATLNSLIKSTVLCLLSIAGSRFVTPLVFEFSRVYVVREMVGRIYLAAQPQVQVYCMYVDLYLAWCLGVYRI